MKTLKFKHDAVEAIKRGEVTATWRLKDDKNITVDDLLEFIDTSNMEAFGSAVVNEVVAKRLKDLTDADKLGHESYISQTNMYDALRQYYGKDVVPESHIKIIRFEFTPYSAPKLPENDAKNTIQYPDIKLFTDGGSRGNPGPSASGFVLLNPHNDAVIEEGGDYLGVTTNNQAEYQAVRSALQASQRLGARRVDAYMDSLLVVNQMKGIFKVRNRDLWPIHDDIKKLVKTFESVHFTHVPREQNKLADAKVNQILDAQVGPSNHSVPPASSPQGQLL